MNVCIAVSPIYKCGQRTQDKVNFHKQKIFFHTHARFDVHVKMRLLYTVRIMRYTVYFLYLPLPCVQGLSFLSELNHIIQILCLDFMSLANSLGTVMSDCLIIITIVVYTYIAPFREPKVALQNRSHRAEGESKVVWVTVTMVIRPW